MSDGAGAKRSSGGLVSASILAVVLLTVAGTVIFWGYSKQVEYYRNADQNSAEYTRNSYAPEVDSCLILPRQSQSDCIAEAANKERNYRRDEQALAAQKTSAVWTYLMGSAALIGMILSAFGVFLVWRTFSATREANLIAREIGEAQVRAYLDVTGVKFYVDAVQHIAGIDIAVSNLGATPATDVEACFHLVIIDDVQGKIEVDFRTGLPDIPSGSERNRANGMIRDDLRKIAFGKDPQNIGTVSVQTAVFAYDVFGNEIRASCNNVGMWQANDFGTGVLHDLKRTDGIFSIRQIEEFYSIIGKDRLKRRKK